MGEVGVDLFAEAAVKSLQVVETAKSKVKFVAKASGLLFSHGSEPQASSSGVDLSSAEAAIFKQVAMAKKMTRKAEEAVNR